jgi:hypothetical protein
MGAPRPLCALRWLLPTRLRSLPKCAAGYDLTRLSVGSEIRLHLHGIAQAMSSRPARSPPQRGPVETVIAILQMGIPVACMELPDEVQMAARIAFFKFPRTAAAMAEPATPRRKGFRQATDALRRIKARPRL